MLLLASFHVHTNHSIQAQTTHERHASNLDGDNCLLCQFQHVFYEDVPQMSAMVFLPESTAEAAPIEIGVSSVSDQKTLTRAPPVLL